jgi:S-DNA-T family DNA segregation ATPase FtsK/SpoIIIE
VSRNSTRKKQARKTPLITFKPTSGSQSVGRAARKLTRQVSRISPERKKDILGIAIVFLGLLSLMSLITGGEGGLFGLFSKFLQQLAGFGAIFLPFILIILGVWLLFRNEHRLTQISAERLLGIILLTINLFTWMHWLAGGGWELVKTGRGGGVLGAIFERILALTLGDLGGFIFLVAWLLIALMFAFDIALPDLFRNISNSARKTKDFVSKGVDQVSQKRTPPDLGKTSNTATELDKSVFVPFKQDQKFGTSLKNAAKKVFDQKKGSTKTGTITSKTDLPAHTGLQVHRKSSSSGVHPPQIADMLDQATKMNFQEDLDKNRARIIEETLESMGAPSKVVEIHHGPTFTQFCLEPGLVDRRAGPKRVMVSKISNHAGDIALALSVRNVRMETPVPGKSYIGIEVPNNDLELVSLREGMESETFRKAKGDLKFVLGKDVSGKSYTVSLGDMPHLLIAGSTGTGKSVCMNSILACYLLQYSPDELKLLMIDPKRVELTNYNRIPHLINPVIVDPEKVPAYLKWLVREMERRLEEFRALKVRDITEYNATQKEKMPFIVVAIDELATLMMLSPVETETALNRLAEMARATGIHLLIATQRPSVDVITGKIKANFPTRIAFAVVSGIDSRVGIDKSGADRLVGKGDMLFHTPELGVPKRLQGVFVSDHEIERIVDYWQKVGEEQKHQAQLNGEPPAENMPVFASQPHIPLKDLENGDEDALIQKAIDVIRLEERASISLLQRKLSIGYMRAARMVEKLEQMGIIGKPEPGSGVRPVLDFGDEHPK